MTKKIFIFLLSILFSWSFAQKKMKRLAAIGFYNVENLWDTIPSADYVDGTLPLKHKNFHRSVPIDSIAYLEKDSTYKGKWVDENLIGKKVIRYQTHPEDFTPKSSKNYNTQVYRQKLLNTAKVISELGASYTKIPPVVVGLVEVENRAVLEDLIVQPSLKAYNYGIEHYNSYDARGIDVALIYQKNRFTVTESRKKELVIFSEDGLREYTRDILIVEGILDGEKTVFFVNHWPSRRGGEVISAPKRNYAATVLEQEMNFYQSQNPMIKLFIMGDFNDDPTNESLIKHLACVTKEKNINADSKCFNPFYRLFQKGQSTLAYRDSGNLFDQILFSTNVIENHDEHTYSFYRSEIYAPPYLVNSYGNYKGYPFRSWNGDRFTGGYSDHFPVFIVLEKSVQP